MASGDEIYDAEKTCVTCAGLLGIWLGFPMILLRVFCGVSGLEWEQTGFPLGNM